MSEQINSNNHTEETDNINQEANLMIEQKLKAKGEVLLPVKEGRVASVVSELKFIEDNEVYDIKFTTFEDVAKYLSDYCDEFGYEDFYCEYSEVPEWTETFHEGDRKVVNASALVPCYSNAMEPFSSITGIALDTRGLAWKNYGGDRSRFENNDA